VGDGAGDSMGCSPQPVAPVEWTATGSYRLACMLKIRYERLTKDLPSRAPQKLIRAPSMASNEQTSRIVFYERMRSAYEMSSVFVAFK
jgi:hypothetical protein